MPWRSTRDWRRAWRWIASRSEEQRQKDAALLLALLLVAVAAAFDRVTGLTVVSAPFTLYGLAVAVAAARGGFVPATVAALASVVAVALDGPRPTLGARALFVTESLSVALVVCALRN